MADATRLDALIVGAGFAGLYMLHKLRGMGLAARAVDAASGVGGTWYWNRYPGARCDVESMFYCYQFDDDLSQEWEWTERYPAQPEILRYANHVADRFDLWPDIRLNTRVVSAVYDEGSRRLADRDGHRRDVPRELLHHGDRLPVGRRTGPISRGSTISRAGYSTPGTGRTSRSISPAGGSA